MGLAYPQAIPIVKACVDSALQLGLPEARLPLADAAVLMATAPKSNSAHNAILAAEQDLRRGKTGPVPRQLQNKHFDGEDAAQRGRIICTRTIIRPLGGSSSTCRTRWRACATNTDKTKTSRPRRLTGTKSRSKGPAGRGGGRKSTACACGWAAEAAGNRRVKYDF